LQRWGKREYLHAEIYDDDTMTLFIEIINIVVPVFLVIGMGFGLKRIGLVSSDFLFQLNRLLYYLALPLLLFFKIATADFMNCFNGSQVLALVLTTAIGFVVSYGYAVLRAYPPAVRGAFSQACFRGNLAYIGLAIVYNAYGEAGLAGGGVLLGFVVPALNFFSVIALLLPHRQEKGKFSVGLLVRQVVVNPLIIACFAGTLWSISGFGVPKVLSRTLHIVTAMALPLALIAIGASFSLNKIRGDLTKALQAVVFKLIGLPMLATALLLVLDVHGRDLAIGILFAGTPTATVAYIMAQQMKGDAELSGTIIMLSTLLSIMTYTIALLVLRAYGV
jgi:predicted permease